MSTTITSNTGATTTPETIMPVALTAPGRAKLHPIIGESAPDVTFIPTQPRAGDLSYLYPDEASAVAALDLHRTGVWFALDVVSPTLSLEMTYVVPDTDRMRLEQQAGNRKWLLVVPAQEIAS